MRLSDQRYEEIKREIAIFLEDYDIKKLPIDVFEIAKKMKIKIVYASELLEKYPNKLNEYILFTYPDSYLVYSPEMQQFVIYIDNVGTKKKRQRFSLAHELMHIILGHDKQSLENEAEANYGATYLLAPTSLALVMLEDDRLSCPEILSDIFDVSTSEAKIIARYNLNRLSLNDLEERDYEKTINRLLSDSLKSKLRQYH